MPTKSLKVTEPSVLFKSFVIATICIGAIPLLAIVELKWIGWLLMGLSTILLAIHYRSRFSRHIWLLIGVLCLLGLVPINTSIEYGHFLFMGSLLIATVALPLLITRRIFKEKTISFPIRMSRKWRKKEIAYVFIAGIGAYLLLPFYLGTTSSYLNWGAVLEPSYIIRLFIGTNALGIWDEVFFVGVCLALLRRHLPFLWANLTQATLWTTFLYELGFRGWGPVVIFFFAVSQGYIFKNSKSLLYIITVHLTIDFMLFLVLIHLNNPDYLRIFITSPF